MSAFERFLHLRGTTTRAAAINPDGELITRTPAEMVALIGAVAKTGDTMTGVLTASGGSVSNPSVRATGNIPRHYAIQNASAPSGSRNWALSVNSAGKFIISKWSDDELSGGNIGTLDGFGIDVPGVLVYGNAVVGARKTGWTIPSGTKARTGFDPSTVTLEELGQRVAALIADLHATGGHGMIG